MSSDSALTDLVGAPSAPSPLPKIFQYHADFLENLAKSYVGASRKVGTPPTGNPATATTVERF